MSWLAVSLIVLAIFVFRHRTIFDPRVGNPGDIDLHAIVLARRSPDAQLIFLGDSITERWGYRPELWKEFSVYRPANLGCGGDRIGNVRWRVEHGALDGILPKAIVLLAGANDVGGVASIFKDGNPSAAEIVEGESFLIAAIRQRQPSATIILMDLTPRRMRMQVVRNVNAGLEKITGVIHLDISPDLEGPDGEPAQRFTTDGVHLTDAGYAVWYSRLRPILVRIFGY